MDSKITKKRLSNFFQYEWIILLVVIIASIILMEFVYSVAGVRLTVGQEYKIYFDQNVSPVGTAFYDSLNYGEEDSVLSYDVLKLDAETLQSDYNVLSTRLSVQEGDLIITDNYISPQDLEEDPLRLDNRANYLIDNSYNIYSLDSLYEDMGKYLTKFLKTNETEIIKDNIDENKIKSTFLTRMKKDNRFRTDKEKANGIELEKKRILKLFDEYEYFTKVFEYGEENNWFYKYKRYDYILTTNVKEKTYYETANQTAEVENFGLLLGEVSGISNVSAEKYFSVKKTGNADNLVLLVFDFENYQPELQYESVSVINNLIRILTGYNTASDFPA